MALEVLKRVRREKESSKALEGFVVYTVEEAEVLKGKSEWTKRMVHEAKKYGVKIIGEEGTWIKNHN